MTRKRISRILELKQFTKDICETELKKSLESLQTEKTKLTHIEKDMQKTLSDYKEMHKDGLVNIHELEMFNNYLFHMNKQAGKQKEVISKKTLDVEKKKDKMINAYKEKQMVEIIHNKLLQKEIKESDKKEQKQLDFNFLHKK